MHYFLICLIVIFLSEYPLKVMTYNECKQKEFITRHHFPFEPHQFSHILIRANTKTVVHLKESKSNGSDFIQLIAQWRHSMKANVAYTYVNATLLSSVVAWSGSKTLLLQAGHILDESSDLSESSTWKFQGTAVVMSIAGIWLLLMIIATILIVTYLKPDRRSTSSMNPREVVYINANNSKMKSSKITPLAEEPFQEGGDSVSNAMDQENSVNNSREYVLEVYGPTSLPSSPGVASPAATDSSFPSTIPSVGSPSFESEGGFIQSRSQAVISNPSASLSPTRGRKADMRFMNLALLATFCVACLAQRQNNFLCPGVDDEVTLQISLYLPLQKLKLETIRIHFASGGEVENTLPATFSQGSLKSKVRVYDVFSPPSYLQSPDVDACGASSACSSASFSQSMDCDLFTGDCICQRGFYKKGDSCTDVDECNMFVSPPCDRNARCINTHGSYLCLCNRGYQGDGKQCQSRAAIFQFYSVESRMNVCPTCPREFYDVNQCLFANISHCIHVTKPIRMKSERETTSVRGKYVVKVSSNVIDVDVQTFQPLVHNFTVTKWNQSNTVTLSHGSEGSVELKVQISHNYLLPHYVDVRHDSDNDYILQQPEVSTMKQQKETFLHVIRNYCRHPIPPSYLLTMKLYRRHTKAIKVLCDKKTLRGNVRCPADYLDGQVYYYRTVNQQCVQNLDNAKMILQDLAPFLPPSRNTLYCTQNAPLVQTLFRTNLTESVSYHSDFGCDMMRRQCLHCVENAEKSCSDEGVSCCQTACFQRDFCLKYYSTRCFPSANQVPSNGGKATDHDDMCYVGETARFRLAPDFKFREGNFQCHLQYLAPTVERGGLYTISYQMRILPENWLTNPRKPSIKGKEIRHQSGISTEFSHVKQRAAHRNDISHHLDGALTVEHELFHLLDNEMISSWNFTNHSSSSLPSSSIGAFNITQRLSSSMLASLHSLKRQGEFQKTLPEVVTLMGEQFMEVQLARPFLFSSANWYDASCFVDINNIYPYQSIHHENRSSWRLSDPVKYKNGSRFHYWLSGGEQHPMITITLTDIHKALSAEFCPLSARGARRRRLIRGGKKEPHVVFEWNPVYNVWTVRMKGYVSGTPTYLRAAVVRETQSHKSIFTSTNSPSSVLFERAFFILPLSHPLDVILTSPWDVAFTIEFQFPATSHSASTHHSPSSHQWKLSELVNQLEDAFRLSIEDCEQTHIFHLFALEQTNWQQEIHLVANMSSNQLFSLNTSELLTVSYSSWLHSSQAWLSPSFSLIFLLVTIIFTIYVSLFLVDLIIRHYQHISCNYPLKNIRSTSQNRKLHQLTCGRRSLLLIYITSRMFYNFLCTFSVILAVILTLESRASGLLMRFFSSHHANSLVKHLLSECDTLMLASRVETQRQSEFVNSMFKACSDVSERDVHQFTVWHQQELNGSITHWQTVILGSEETVGNIKYFVPIAIHHEIEENFNKYRYSIDQYTDRIRSIFHDRLQEKYRSYILFLRDVNKTPWLDSAREMIRNATATTGISASFSKQKTLYEYALRDSTISEEIVDFFLGLRISHPAVIHLFPTKLWKRLSSAIPTTRSIPVATLFRAFNKSNHFQLSELFATRRLRGRQFFTLATDALSNGSILSQSSSLGRPMLLKSIQLPLSVNWSQTGPTSFRLVYLRLAFFLLDSVLVTYRFYQTYVNVRHMWKGRRRHVAAPNTFSTQFSLEDYAGVEDMQIRPMTSSRRRCSDCRCFKMSRIRSMGEEQRPKHKEASEQINKINLVKINSSFHAADSPYATLDPLITSTHQLLQNSQTLTLNKSMSQKKPLHLMEKWSETSSASFMLRCCRSQHFVSVLFGVGLLCLAIFTLSWLGKCVLNPSWVLHHSRTLVRVRILERLRRIMNHLAQKQSHYLKNTVIPREKDQRSILQRVLLKLSTRYKHDLRHLWNNYQTEFCYVLHQSNASSLLSPDKCQSSPSFKPFRSDNCQFLQPLMTHTPLFRNPLMVTPQRLTADSYPLRVQQVLQSTALQVESSSLRDVVLSSLTALVLILAFMMICHVAGNIFLRLVLPSPRILYRKFERPPMLRHSNKAGTVLPLKVDTCPSPVEDEPLAETMASSKGVNSHMSSLPTRDSLCHSHEQKQKYISNNYSIPLPSSLSLGSSTLQPVSEGDSFSSAEGVENAQESQV